MIINRATLQSVYKGFKVIFNEALEAAKPLYDQIATTVTSTTREEEYKWLGRMPRLREWIGDRVVQNLSAFGYTIKNRDFEATVAIDRNDIEDDTIGVYTPVIQELGRSAAMHPDELIFELLAKGFENLCYDGQYFFDTDHKDGDGPVQSNRGTAKLSVTEYAKARAAMMSLKDEHGRPLGIIPDLLVVPPALEQTALEILQAERTASGATNVFRNTAKLLVAPQLAGYDTYWFLLCTSRAVKPFIYQRRKAPEFVAKDNLNDDNVFFNKQFIYGVDTRENAGYGLWQLAWGSDGSV